MYTVLHTLLSDKKGGLVFTCFGVWHLFYILLAFCLALAVILYLKKRGASVRERVICRLIHIAFGIYLADFFLMTLAYGEIDIEKLPFHICTVTCVLCFLSRHIRFWEKYRVQIALVAFLSNLVYLIYPAGVMWHQVHPLSYRVVQTLIFHAVMTVYGLMVLIFDTERLQWKTCYRDLVLLVLITAWALLGNLCYNGSLGDYQHFFNWFFVIRDPFYRLPEAVAPYCMPFINIALFFSAEMLIYGVYLTVEKRKSKKAAGS